METSFKNPMDMRGKHILVTGASSGLGRATALLLSQLGAKLALTGREEGRLRSTFDSLVGVGHTWRSFDLSNHLEIPQFMKQIVSDGGPLTGMFHSAGEYILKPIGLVKGGDIDQIFSIAVKSMFLLVSGFCKKGIVNGEIQSSIILMTSVAAFRGQPGLACYAASKGAIEGAVRSLACELSQKNIRINCICGGAVKTEMQDRIFSALTEDALKNYEARHLFGFGQPGDIANGVAFLLSDASRWITGTSLVIDGGYSCR